MGKRLRPGYSAWVNTDEVTLVVTGFGPIPQPVQVFVEGGGELPDNLAEGEEARLDALGAFTPLAPYAERVAAQGSRLVADAPPEGEASVKAAVVAPEVDDDLLPPPLPAGSVDEAGRVSPDLAHDTAPEGEAVQPNLSDEERFAAAQELAQAEGAEEAASVEKHARAKRARKSAE
jgi:hypothetical protein